MGKDSTFKYEIKNPVRLGSCQGKLAAYQRLTRFIYLSTLITYKTLVSAFSLARGKNGHISVIIPPFKITLKGSTNEHYNASFFM